MTRPQRIAVVGAGPSGLAALRALRGAGLDAMAYERSDAIGGIWSLSPRKTAAYRSLHLITSKPRTEFGEHPMPAETPDYPARNTVGRYLRDYAERFGLGPHIRLGAEVTKARREPGAGWRIELGSGEVEEADALVVANGHNDVPKLPDPPYPGSFDGAQLHALDYGDASDHAGERVLVVGMGNSAMDIATDISHVASRTLLSIRRGSWVIPKQLLGRPADQVIRPFMATHVPWRLRQPLAQRLLRIAVGSPERYGLPAPQRGLFQDHPTISDTILSRISHGKIEPKPGIVELGGGSVRFTDGSEEPVDTIVWCTGYRVDIPFLDRALTGEDPQGLLLYKRIFHLSEPGLYFIGFMQSTGSAFPIVERQARLLAAYLMGEWALPPPEAMRADCERTRERALARWGPHGRPAMRVDFDLFMHELEREMARGRRRARGSRAA